MADPIVAGEVFMKKETGHGGAESSSPPLHPVWLASGACVNCELVGSYHVVYSVYHFERSSLYKCEFYIV